MIKTARAIIKIDNEYIFMKRVKKSEEGLYTYYATLGGHLEKNETFEEAVIREIYEESNLKCKVEKLFMEIESKDINRYEKIYLVSVISGIPSNGSGEEFSDKVDFEKYGSFEIVKLNKKELERYNILPKELKEKMIKEL